MSESQAISLASYELMAQQQRLQAVLDSIDDGLLMFDRNGLLEHFNINNAIFNNSIKLRN